MTSVEHRHTENPGLDDLAVGFHTEATAPQPDTFRPTTLGWIMRGAVVAAVAFVVFGSVLVVEGFRANEFTGAIVFAVAGLSLNVLIGYTGTLSLGHQAFVGIGAFTSAYLVSVHGQSFWLGVAVAAVIGGIQALLLGLVALRISGLYFALITLSYGILAQESFFNIEEFTGGAAGQPAPPPVDSFVTYYYIGLLFLGAVLYVDWQMMRSKAGRALLALRENPKVAQTFSINVNRYTLVGFMTAGIFAGVGGAYKAHADGFVVSNPFDFQFALLLVIVTVVGGLRSRAGIIVSSIIFSQLKFLIETVPGLNAALARWDRTLPVLLIVIFVTVGVSQVFRAVESGEVRNQATGVMASLVALACVLGTVTGTVALFWIVLAAAGVSTVAVLLRGRPDWADINRRRLIVLGVIALVALATLLADDFPVLDDLLAKIPVLTPEIARVVLAPTLLLVVLTTLPGGLGQLIRPVQHWIRGNRFDWSVGVQEEVVVSDVRA